MDIIQTAKICIPWNETTFTSLISFIHYYYQKEDFKTCELFLTTLINECLIRVTIEHEHTLKLFIMLKNLYIKTRDYEKLIKITKNILIQISTINDKTLIFFKELLYVTVQIINNGQLSYSLDFINMINTKQKNLNMNKDNDIYIELMKVYTLWYQKSKQYEKAKEMQVYVIEILLTKYNNIANQHIINNIANYLYLVIMTNSENIYNINYLYILTKYIDEHINDKQSILPLLILLNHFDTSKERFKVYMNRLNNLMDISFNCDSIMYITYQLYKREIDNKK